MIVENTIKKLRALPVRLRFHLLFAIFINPEKSRETLSLIDTQGEMLAELTKDLNDLPMQIRMVLIASELKQCLQGS